MDACCLLETNDAINRFLQCAAHGGVREVAIFNLLGN